MTTEEQGNSIEVAGLIAAKCPTCGGILSIKKGGEARCDYCGNKFIQRESYQGKSREIRNYYDLAYAAQEIGDAAGAYKYFTKVLELDSTEALAWYGKGCAALGYSRTLKINTTEAVSLFTRALTNVAGEEKDHLRETIQESCFYYADSIFDYLAGRWGLNAYNSRGIMALFEFADEVLPLENEQLKRIVVILCGSNLLPPSETKEKVDYYTGRIRAADPTYLNPWEEEEERKRRERGPVRVDRREFKLLVLLAVSLTLLFCAMCYGIYFASTLTPAEG